MRDNKFTLHVNEMPTKWYNILPDLPTPLAPPLNPATKKIVTPEDLSVLFPMEIIKQEMSSERFIEIPDEVLDIYSLSRPTPVIRAYRLEKYLDTPAKIYFKYEGANSSGSHKLNTSIAQAYYNKKEGVKRITTETGAGQWGSALSMACNHFNLECQVFMVKVSYQQKPYRKSLMQLFGAEVIPSPSNLTTAGRNILSQDPNSPGSLGIAISEAVEMAAQRNDTKYSLGSVLNHVILHQTIIGEEAKLQMEMAGDYPDVVIACVGGGTNFGGISIPFLRDKLSGEKKDLEVIAVEPSSCPTLTKGTFAYDYGDEAGFAPIVKMYTLGHNFIPAKIHAGGLRYHGMSPLISHLMHLGLIKAEAYYQKEIFEAARIFAQEEGIVPAPESSHAIKSAIEYAKRCKESGEKKTILFNLSGHGFLDLGAYESFLSNHLEDHEMTDEEIAENLKCLPDIDL